MEKHNEMKFVGELRPWILRKFLAMGIPGGVPPQGGGWGGPPGGGPLGGSPPHGGRGGVLGGSWDPLPQKRILRFLGFGPPQGKKLRFRVSVLGLRFRV